MERQYRFGGQFQSQVYGSIRRLMVVGFVAVEIIGGISAFAAGPIPARVIRNGNLSSALNNPPDLKNVDPATGTMDVEISDVEVVEKDQVELKDTTGNFQVKSSYGTDREKIALNAGDLRYAFKETQFGMVNTFYWIQKGLRQTLDVGGLKSEGKPMNIAVDAHCMEMANAYFNPIDNQVCLGTVFVPGGRDAFLGGAGVAWESDIAAHEFGHGVFHHSITFSDGLGMIYRSVRGNDQLRAMNEGQADFYAYATTGNKTLGNWFMYFLTEGREKSDRMLNNSLNLHDDIANEAHQDGQIFSGALFDMSERVGVKETQRLWAAALPTLSETDNYYDYAQAILNADREINSSKNANALREVMMGRQMMGNPELTANDLKFHITVNDSEQAIRTAFVRFATEGGGFLNVRSEKANGDGILQAGECAPVEIQIENASTHDLVGLEMFIPPTELPKGLSIDTATRIYVGTIGTGKIKPSSLQRSVTRSWFFACADDTYVPGKNVTVLMSDASAANLLRFEIPVQSSVLQDNQPAKSTTFDIMSLLKDL